MSMMKFRSPPGRSQTSLSTTSGFFPYRCFKNSIIGGISEISTTTITTFSI